MCGIGLEAIEQYETSPLAYAQQVFHCVNSQHCTQPILARFGLESSVRPWLVYYNTRDEVDVLIEVLHKISLPQ
jgi:selenocysteine lyase/cysteine desulfurase